MGHNSVVSGHPKSIGIPRVVNGTLGFGVPQNNYSIFLVNFHRISKIVTFILLSSAS